MLEWNTKAVTMGDDESQVRLRSALAELIRVTAENERLRSENHELRSTLERIGSMEREADTICDFPISAKRAVVPITSAITFRSPKEAKIELFRSLFRGRKDVYPVRWVSRKTGKAGYSPALKDPYRRWEAKNSDKSSLPPSDYLPLTDQVIQDRLEGRIVVGVYPLLTDETCWFLAVDFDGRGFQEDASTFADICGELEIPVAIERSRSRNGAHVWMFFEEALSAGLARKLGFAVLTRAMEKRHEITLKSYDRLFPNQDTLPKGGFGNLIALPLQRDVRDGGGSVFVDNKFRDYEDQWAFLASVKRVGRSRLERLVNQAEEEGRVIGLPLPATEDEETEDPWTRAPSRRKSARPLSGPFPEHVKIVRSGLTYVEKKDLSGSVLDAVRRVAAFQNPEFFRFQAMRLPVYDKPRIIDCSEDDGRFIALPRGCFEQLLEFFAGLKISLTVEDCRECSYQLDVRFSGLLTDSQERAVDELSKHEIGVLSATTGFGKTVVAAAMIAARGVNTLILVHRQQLMEQWRERLQTFLGIDRKGMGQIGAGKARATKLIDIAMLQSMVRHGIVRDEVADYGHVIVDECHHISAYSFEQVMRNARAKFVLGLTATLKRKDGHHPIMVMQCGPIRHTVSTQQARAESKLRSEVLVRSTSFTWMSAPALPSVHEIYEALARDSDRNSRIIGDIVSVVEAGRSPLILTERMNHLEILEGQLAGAGIEAFVLRGGMGKRQRASVMAMIADTESRNRRVILASGRYIGEGFDDAMLDTLFLAMPVSWSGTLQQYVGRLHRMRAGKNLLQVYDYVDFNVPLLAKMFRRRSKGYRAMGYEITAPSTTAT